MHPNQDWDDGLPEAAIVKILQVQRQIFHLAAAGRHEGLCAFDEGEDRGRAWHDKNCVGAALHTRHGVAQQDHPAVCVRHAGQSSAQEMDLRGPGAKAITPSREMLARQFPCDGGRIGGQELGDGAGPQSRHGSIFGAALCSIKQVPPVWPWNLVFRALLRHTAR